MQGSATEIYNVFRANCEYLSTIIIICTCMSIIGREFQAVFLSTSEPTLSNFQVSNPTKSISDPYVFNTAITRAQSLVVSVGNPFTLLKTEQHMKEKYGDRGRCWTYYLTLCLQNNTIYFSDSLGITKKLECLQKLRRLFQPLKSTQFTPDSILKAYQEDVQKLRETGLQKSHSDEVKHTYTAKHSNKSPQQLQHTKVMASPHGPENMPKSQLQIPSRPLIFTSPSNEDDRWEIESVASQSSFSSEASTASSSRHSSDTSGYYSEESGHESEVQLSKAGIQQPAVVVVKPQKTEKLQIEHYKESESKLDLTTVMKPIRGERYQQKFHRLILMEKDAHIKSTER